MTEKKLAIKKTPKKNKFVDVSSALVAINKEREMASLFRKFNAVMEKFGIQYYDRTKKVPTGPTWEWIVFQTYFESLVSDALAIHCLFNSGETKKDKK